MHEMLRTKMRAMFQRKRGRDLFGPILNGLMHRRRRNRITGQTGVGRFLGRESDSIPSD
jgi:hypothetical protein